MRGVCAAIVIVSVIVQSLGATPLLAQTGGPYNLEWNTIDGGGATFVQGGVYALGGTIGQTDAGAASGGVYTLRSGFWGGLVVAPVPTQTPTIVGPALTPTSTRTAADGTPTVTAVVPTVTPVGGSTATATPLTPVPTSTGTPTRTRTTTRTPTPTVTGSPPPVPCYGDCNSDLMVSVDELVRSVSIALDILPISNCPDFGGAGQSTIAIDELVAAVYASLNGCNTEP